MMKSNVDWCHNFENVVEIKSMGCPLVLTDLIMESITIGNQDVRSKMRQSAGIVDTS